MANMANSSYNTISELKVRPTDEENDMDYHNWKLLVRVTRLCEVYNTKNKTELFYVNMVLIDVEGSVVHAQISKSNWLRFRGKVSDGQIHIIKNFDVLPNLESYRLVGDSKVMIKFHFSTYVKTIDITEAKIPLHRFEFLEFHNVELRRDNPTVLTDLFGLVVNEIVKPNYFAIEFEDQGGQRLRVALWDQLLKEYKAEKQRHNNQTGALIVTLSSLLVRTYKEKYTNVYTSPSSRIYINIDIPEVISLKDYLRGDNIEVQIESKTDEVREKDIASILAHCKEEFFQDLICYCTAKVTGIERRKSWYYRSCFRCPSRPQLKDSIDWCYGCQKPIEAETIRYCVELKVEDGSGKTRFVVFDNDARRLIGQDAESLKESQPPDDPDNEDPDHTPQLIYDTFDNKEFLFKLKIQLDNHDSVLKKAYKIIDISEKKNNDPKKTSLVNEDPVIVSMETDDTETLAQMSLTRLKRQPKINVVLDSEDDMPEKAKGKGAAQAMRLEPEDNETLATVTKSARLKSRPRRIILQDSDDDILESTQAKKGKRVSKGQKQMKSTTKNKRVQQKGKQT